MIKASPEMIRIPTEIEIIATGLRSTGTVLT